MSDRMRLGIEIGGTKLQLGLGRGDGTIRAIERRTVVAGEGAEGIRKQILDAYPRLLDRCGLDRSDVEAAGVGFGGPVDAATGVTTTSHRIEGWNGFPLAEWVRNELGPPRVVVENDADTAGLGEARFGAGVGFSPVLYLTIGSGIGGGLIINGKIYRGAGAGAIEIGHIWVIDRSGSDMGVVTLEDAASGWAISDSARAFASHLSPEERAEWSVVRLAGGDPSAIETRHIAQAARDGDREAQLLLARAVHAMTNGLAQAVTLIAPRRIILGGGVSLIGEDLWLEPIRRQLNAAVFPPFRGTFDLVGAALGEDVVVHGALALAHDAAANGAG
ncbi:MAG: ROK family protein [Isosphaeraceae bacterium]